MTGPDEPPERESPYRWGREDVEFRESRERMDRLERHIREVFNAQLAGLAARLEEMRAELRELRTLVQASTTIIRERRAQLLWIAITCAVAAAVMVTVLMRQLAGGIR